MTTQLESSIVRIRAADGRTIGAGFLVGDRQVLTCAHVVAGALGLPDDAPEVQKPGFFRKTRFLLDFPLVAPERILTARVTHWQPGSDVAGLELDGDPPAGAQAVRLVTADGLWGHTFRAFGFPAGHDDGVWASGVLRGRTAVGWVQIEDIKEAGYFVAPGFSGTPVWDETLDGVAGMVVTAERKPEVKAAFIIPVNVLVRTWPDLVRILHKPSAPLGKLSNVPDLPPHFLPRADYLEPISAAVLADVDKPVVVTGTTRKVGVQGMGGIGKSVLAAALARDREVRRAFPDGVLWVTVGREPALTPRQSQLVEALGDSPREFEDVQQGRARLSELLADKACLLILDDVWEAKHAEAFDVLGPCCRMLITTRDAGLIVALGAVEHRVDVLSDEQALTLLAEWAGRGVESLPAEAHEVAWECGNLPLALAMTGAMVRGKPDRWGNVLHKLRNADLEKIRQQFPHYPYPNLLRVIQVSVEALEPEVQARYLDFAVFPEDTPIPEAVLEMFWEPEGLGAYNVQDVVDVLVDRSLARRDAAGSLNPHDLQFDYVRRQAEDLPALHDRLLRAYAARCPGDWPTGPDDGYFFEHLVYHLVEAGREMDEILSLVENPTWRRARRREDVAGSSLAQDIERLCRAAERGGLSTLVQYIAASLLKAILRSQITNLPVETVEAFARLGHFDQALSLTRLMVGEVPRVTALWRLGQWCLERGRLGAAADLLKEARAGILALEKDKEKPRHLARLASHFSQAKRPDEAQRSLGMAFELLDTLENEAEQGRALDALVYGMRDHDAAMLEAWLAEAERAARQIERIHSYRALALARIAEQFHRIDAEHARTLVQEALCILSSAPASYAGEGISGIVFSQRDAFLATTIGIAVQIGLENEALGLLQTIQDSAARVTAYAELGRAYADQQRTKKAENYLRQALTVAETELEGVAQDSFKCQLVNLLLRISQVDQTQQVANSIQDQTERVYAFCAIAEHLGRDGRSEEARDWIEQMAVEWGGAFGKAAIGAALIKSDPDSALEEIREALQLARQIREGIVGSKHDAYAFITACVGGLADPRRRQAEDLLEQIVADLQSEAGRHSMEIYGVTQARDEALYCLVEILAASGHYTEGAGIARDIARGYARDQALLLCVRAACAADDWGTSDVFLSDMTSDCGRLIGDTAREGWQAQVTQPLNQILEGIEKRVSETCDWLPRPIDALGDVALELGISGHITAAQTLWTKLNNPIARQRSQVELVQLLTRAGRVGDAQRLVNDIEYASLKAQAMAYVARCYSDKDLSSAQALVDQVWRAINPHNIPPEYWIRGWHTDEALVVLAGTVARWDLSEADQIVTEWIEEEDNRQRARAEVVAAFCASDSQSACVRLKEIVAEGAGRGLAGFWQSLAASSEALNRLVGIENIMQMYQHFVRIEGRQRLSD